MSGDGSCIEVLQQIAVNNQLSPSIYSPSTQQESKALINHPFYQNLSRQQENMPYSYKQNESGLSNQQLANKTYQAMPVFRETKGKENYTRRPESNRYGQAPATAKNQAESFQSISTVSMNNEISGATDMQLDDFFDQRHKKGKGCI